MHPIDMMVTDYNCEYLGLSRLCLMESAGKSLAEEAGKIGEGTVFADVNEVLMAYSAKTVHLHTRCAIRGSSLRNKTFTEDALREAAKMGCRKFIGVGSQAECGLIDAPISS